MSMPNLGNNHDITRDEAVNLILASLAMEELSLSHIINAEGEKMQYALGTLHGTSEPVEIKDILELNQSVRDTLNLTMQNQMFLNAKLGNATSLPTMQGPPGPMGPVGVILDSYDSLEDLKNAHQTGNQGDTYLVGGELYTWDTDNREWKLTGDLSGPQGSPGPMGPVGVITGTVDSPGDLPSEGQQGDSYLVNGVLYVWNEETSQWEVRGDLTGPAGPTGPRGLTGAEGPQGPEGPQGIQGIAGTVGTIKGSYTSEAEMRAAHPDGGEPGDFYYINPDLWVWDEDNNDWIDVGQIAGPQGIQGVQGERGEQGPTGDTGPVGTVLGSYNTLIELEDEHPTGNQGDAFLVGGELYIWNITSESWEPVGNLQGPEGPAGPSGKMCTIIPFSSGEAEYLTSSAGGNKSAVVSIGFGQKFQIGLQENEYIDLPVITGGGQQQLAFSMPSSGVISSMSAFFSLTTTALTNNYIIAELYYTTSDSPNNRFYPVPGAMIQLYVPVTDPIGSVYDGVIENINFQVPPRTRLLMVFYNTTPIGLTSTLTGFMSGGVKIEDQ